VFDELIGLKEQSKVLGQLIQLPNFNGMHSSMAAQLPATALVQQDSFSNLIFGLQVRMGKRSTSSFSLLNKQLK
jgi:hypothetical protein